MSMELLFSSLIGRFFQNLLFLLRLLVDFFDVRIGLVAKNISRKPTRRIFVQSTSSSRRIAVDVYEPPSVGGQEHKGLLPVLINFHGSGFVLHVHGCDSELCTYWSRKLNCVVLDADYAKGPSNPHPAATRDALDVFAYVATQSDKYDLSRVALVGYSSGGNIAMLAALQNSVQEVNIKALIAWYTPTNMGRAGDPSMAATPFRHRIHQAFRQCYLPPGIDRTTPDVSPLFAQSRLFPPLTLIVGEDDKLMIDSVELKEKLQKDEVDCVLHTIPDAGHAWERFVKEGTPGWAARLDAFSLMEKRLREAFQS